MKRIFVVFFLAVLGGAGYAFWKGIITVAMLEHTAPEIMFKDKPAAIGATAAHITFEASDLGAGIDEVVARISQNGKISTVFQKAFPPGSPQSSNITFDIDGKTQNLREGEASLEITAFDKSFWSNKTTVTLPLIVDYVRPQGEVLSVYHYGSQGGALLVVYRQRSDDIVKSGVNVALGSGEILQVPGHQALLFEKSFSSEPKLYFSLFPLPVGFIPGKGKVEVFVEDKAGNVGIVPFFNKIQPKKFREEEYIFPKTFYVNKVADLLPKYFSEAKLASRPVASADSPQDELIADFRLVNEDYRRFLEKKLVEITKKSVEERLWNGAFQRPLAAAPTASFGEVRHYSLEGKPAGGSVHMGVDLAQSANAQVRPANSGKIVYADDFGIYGNAIIIDHGFGLMTLYGHLSAILVSVGEMVTQSTVIGRTGDTGLAGGDHLHYEVRLFGVPVTPIEWFDPKWIQDKVDGQFQMVKEAIGEGK
jgi:murein DD-endopeptidase MepM/ murein hydrolase activator NlpD